MDSTLVTKGSKEEKINFFKSILEDLLSGFTLKTRFSSIKREDKKTESNDNSFNILKQKM